MKRFELLHNYVLGSNACALSLSKAPKQQKPSYPYSKSKIDWDKLDAQVNEEV